MALSTEQVTAQSKNAYNQWKDVWREHAKAHSKYAMRPMAEFENSGVGRAALCVGNGWSFEREIETIKKYAHNVDILACDKSLGHLIRHGIRPKFCLVADARVDYDKYLAPYADQLGDTILFGNVCSNPRWAEAAWKDRYFHVVKDVLGSEKEFQGISGCPTTVVAGTNVSNSQVIMLTQSDNEGRKNLFGYDKILLIGFDYCWLPHGNYYAFDHDGGGKFNYMRHIYARTIRNELCWTSNNLGFSVNWLDGYVKAYQLPVVQCSKDSVFAPKMLGTLSEQMQYSYKAEDAQKVQQLVKDRKALLARAKELGAELGRIAKDHYYACAATV